MSNNVCDACLRLEELATRSPIRAGTIKMAKADIVERIYTRVGFSKKEAADVVESIFEVIKGRLESGEKVKVSGFGNFVINEKRPRKGRNPQTGEEIIITGRRVLTFKPSQVLKRTINVSNASGDVSGS